MKKIEENYFAIDDPIKPDHMINDGPKYMYDLKDFELGSTWTLSQLFRMWIVVEWMKQWDTKTEGDKKEISILDLGCSWSQLYRVWISHGHYFNHPKTFYVGIDLDVHRLEAGRKAMRVRKSDRVVHIIADATVKRHYGNFNVVACLETLEHVPKKDGEKLIANAWRNVAPGGCLIMSSPNPQKDKGQDSQWGDKHAHEWQWEEVEPVIKKLTPGGTMTKKCGVLPVRSFASQISPAEKEVLKAVRENLPYSLAANLIAPGSDMKNCKQWMCMVQKEG